MKFLLACDKFRGSLSGLEVSENLSEGILRVIPDAEISKSPVADGGEGTLDLLIKAYGAERFPIQVVDALRRTHTVEVGYSASRRLGIVEMASCVGLAILSPNERNPMQTSTYGLGQALRQLVALGSGTILLAIGGSSTNDGGSGILEALGYQFYTKDGLISPVGGNLSDVVEIRSPDNKIMDGVEIQVASDVDNVVCGPSGATYTYAPQKGASDEDLIHLEAGMKHYAELIKGITKTDVFSAKGYGAAGGVALSLCTLLGAKLVSGSELVFTALNLEQKVLESDVIVTGEGKIDGQTLHGKAITPIVGCGLKYGKRVFLVCGIYEPSSQADLDTLPCFELVKLAEETGLDSYHDAAVLVQEIGRRIGRLQNDQAE